MYVYYLRIFLCVAMVTEEMATMESMMRNWQIYVCINWTTIICPEMLVQKNNNAYFELF